MWNDHGRLVVLLATSLLLNVFFCGVLVGRGFVEHRPSPRPPVQSGALVPAAHVGALPEDQKKLFQTAMRNHRDAIRTAQRARKAAREKVEADIAAPVFDRGTVTADFDVLHQTNRDMDAAAGAALIDALSGLSAPSRAALVAHEQAAAAPAAPGPRNP